MFVHLKGNFAIKWKAVERVTGDATTPKKFGSK
jgi:hypothetical protein